MKTWGQSDLSKRYSNCKGPEMGVWPPRGYEWLEEHRESVGKQGQGLSGWMFPAEWLWLRILDFTQKWVTVEGI